MKIIVATHDARSWPANQKLFGLGSWCLRQNPMEQPQEFLESVLHPYGMDPKSKDADEIKAQDLADWLLRELFSCMGNLGICDYQPEELKITLGHWLIRYSRMLVNRCGTLSAAFRALPDAALWACPPDWVPAIPATTGSALSLMNDDMHNWFVFSSIAKSMGLPSIQAEQTIFQPQISPPLPTRKYQLKALAFSLASNLSRWTIRPTSPLVIATYLPKPVESSWLVSNGLVPQFWELRDPDFAELSEDLVLRHKISEMIAAKASGDIELVAAQLLQYLLPKSAVEGFGLILRHIDTLGWPANPPWIFTSNCFDTFETFKHYVVLKKRNGAKYLVGQHGNNYGTLRTMDPSIEEGTSDKFLSWGWTNNRENVVPGFLLKLAKRMRLSTSGDRLVHMQVHRAHSAETWDVWAEFSMYFERQVAFFKSLEESPFDSLAIRLHSAHKSQEFYEKEKFQILGFGDKFEKPNTPWATAIRQARLVVHSYDSTGLIETLYLDKPTVAFWHGGLDQLVEQAKPFYQGLVDAGIIYFDPVQAAEFINKNWSTLDTWWFSPEVRSARDNFLAHYGRATSRPVKTLNDFVKGAL